MSNHLQLISKFAQNLIQLKTQSELSWYVADEIAGDLGLEDCVIYRYDEEKNVLSQIAAYGEKQEAKRLVKNAMDIPLGHGITGAVAISKKGEIIKDITLDERYISDLNGMRSEITVPIVHEGKLYGVIDSENSAVDFFSQEQLDFLNIIAAMLGARLAESNLVYQLQKHQVALSESESKYRSLFEKSDDAMMIMSGNRFVMCNAASARMFHYATAAEMEAIHPSVVSPEDQACGQKSFLKAEEMMATAMTEGYHRFEWLHRTRTGVNFFAEVTLTKILFDGEPGLYAIVRDITEAKNAELAILEALSKAEKANIAKARFLANMSHELRTPLNAIIGFSDAINHEIHGELMPANYKSYIKDIHSSGLFLLELVNDLLELSSIEGNEVEVNQKTIAVETLVQDISSYLGSLLLKKEMEFSCELDLAPKEIVADERALKQIILNLMSNAIKFSPKKSCITLGIEKVKSSVVISVSDQGPGMAPEVIQNITKRFDRGVFDPWNTAIEGSGLGLAIVDGLVALHQGKLSIESEVGVGSKFYVTLPQ